MKTAETKYDLTHGHLERPLKQDAETLAAYAGEMNGNALRLSFFLVPLSKRGERSPDFQIMVIGRSGKASPWGVAWRNYDKTDTPFLSLKFQHPRALPEGLTFTAWPDDEQPKELAPDQEAVFYTIKWAAPRKSGPVEDDFAGMVGAIQ